MAEHRLQFTNKRKFQGLSGNQIKMIAFFLMLCDHVGYILIEQGVLYGTNAMYWNMALETPEGQNWYLAAKILRTIGRLSFPMFAFFIAEGFTHTSSFGRYLTRVGVFAAISEVPFDLACFGTAYYPQYQNVLITYFIALVALYYMKKAEKLHWLVSVLVAGCFCYVAYLVKCDYGAAGVGLICLMYLLRKEQRIRLWAGAAVSAAESFEYYGVSALAFLVIRLYNGKRGIVPMKLFFYIMYPLHLLLFYLMITLVNR